MSWSDWRDEIAKAADPNFYRIEDIEGSLLRGECDFWEGPDWAVITEVVQYKAGERVLQFLWAAGDLEALIAKALPQVEAWARGQGCTSILIEGRKGWEKALRPQGFAPWSVTLRKGLL